MYVANDLRWLPSYSTDHVEDGAVGSALSSLDIISTIKLIYGSKKYIRSSIGDGAAFQGFLWNAALCHRCYLAPHYLSSFAARD